MGLPAFSMGNQLPAVVLIVLATAMAAIGYGILLGSVVRTFEQAIVLGPTSIVIAAALGGGHGTGVSDARIHAGDKQYLAPCLVIGCVL